MYTCTSGRRLATSTRIKQGHGSYAPLSPAAFSNLPPPLERRISPMASRFIEPGRRENFGFLFRIKKNKKSEAPPLAGLDPARFDRTPGEASLPLTLPLFPSSSSISPSLPPSFPLSCSISPSVCLPSTLSLASLMSVLSCGPPFHTAALTITSITRNYLAVFPLPAVSPASISAPELYAFQLGAAAAAAAALPPPAFEQRRKRMGLGE